MQLRICCQVSFTVWGDYSLAIRAAACCCSFVAKSVASELASRAAFADDRLERSGRELPNVHRQRSIKSALSHTVAIVVIGDELLKGRVADTNSSFLATELHRLGWTVTKIIIVPRHSRDHCTVIAA